MEIKIIKRHYVKCPICGSSAVQTHYSNGAIYIVCYGYCGNTIDWS